MLTIAYLANQFPCAVEPYVAEEIEELRSRGVRVIAGSVRKPAAKHQAPEVVLQPLSAHILLRALLLCVRRWQRILPLLVRVVFRGNEGPAQRLKTLVHTWLGACYAVSLENREVEHIHVHHGYFGSWVAMVAARLLGVEYSLTLHGSDLLLHAAYLDAKLANCAFCLTISEYNRRYILEHHPGITVEKIIVSRLGVDVSEPASFAVNTPLMRAQSFSMLAVGRLHEVKDHAFLVRACAELPARSVDFECSIAAKARNAATWNH